MIEISGIKAILTDIEGTTSSISFVHDVLFPYARAHLRDYVRENELAVGGILNEVRALENNPNLSTEDIIGIFISWIDTDRKITPLKSLQGMIWKAGYETGAFKGHIYDDAADALQNWFDKGLKIYIYSSGSVTAQKLIYGYSERGDITPLLSGYFDTTTGPKLEANSYSKIVNSMGFPPVQILFLSDHTGEIDAAHAAGYQAILIDREAQQPKDTRYNVVTDFSSIRLREKVA